MKRYGFWMSQAHYDLGYRPALIEVFANCDEAFDFCERKGPDWVFDNF